MAKFKPGIPDSFTLDVSPVADLGDYLDEPSPMPQRKPKAQGVEVGEGTPAPAATQPAPVTIPAERPVLPTPTPQAVAREPIVERPVSSASPPEATRPAPVVESPPIVLREERVIPQAPPLAPTRESFVNEDRLPKSKAPRREISMTPETLRMSDELLEVIRSGSGQRDTKANELFHALVLLVHEAMDELDPHAIPKRGRWGTPTARAYPLELKNAFLRALLRKNGTEAAA
jgi:hypothetical protein